MKKLPRTANRSRGQRGIVLVLTLMGLLLLAGLVMWVMNLGQQVNNRIVTQGAADTAVQGGAGWIARQLNTVAGNNVDMARYVAVINVLDSFPQAAEYAYKETTTLGEALSNQISSGGVQGAPARLSAVANDYFEQLMAGIEDDINDLEPVVDLFEQFDVSELTFYSQDGHLWRALVAMDETNQALMENLGRMAQVSAVAGGEENLRDQSDSGVFLLPLDAIVPHVRGTFNDLERPVRYGLPPYQTNAETLDSDQTDDDNQPNESETLGVVISGGTNEPQDEWINNRGPWDVIFGWRDYVSEVTNPGTYVPGTRRTAGGGRPSNPLSRREGDNGGRTVGRETEIVAYRTYGPQSYLLRRINEYAHNNLTNTRLTMWLNALAHNKLNFVWPRSKQKRIWEPDWVIDYEEATAIAEAGEPKIRETAFFVAEIKSKYPIGDGNFLREGSYTLAFDEGQINPRIQIVRGWQDPERWGITRLNDYVWRDDWETTVFWDAAIGIEPEYETQVDPETGEVTQVPIPQPVYRYDHIIFGGANIGPEADTRNPYEGFEPDAEDAPSPTDIDHGELARTNEDDRFEHLAYLAIARRNDLPMAWPSHLEGGRPDPNKVAIAQAKVFNNHSWDLWTQMWQAELEPVSNYDQWLEAMSGGQTPPDVDAGDVERLRIYLSNARELAAAMLGH